MAHFARFPTPGEAVHPNLDAKGALKTISALPSLDDKIEAAATAAPGGAKIASIAADANDPTSREFRKLNSAILRRANGPPGATHGIGYQILSNFSSIPEAMLSVSQTLTAAHLQQAEAVPVHGGARCFIIVQFYYDDEGGFRELHAVTILHPHDTRDGEPWFIEPRYNLWQFPGARTDVLDDAHAHLNLQIKSTVDPKTGFERLHADTPPNFKLGMHGNIFAAPFADGRMLAVNLARQVFDGATPMSYHDQSVIEFNIPTHVHQRFAATREMIDLFHQNGEAASFGDIDGTSTCVTTPTRLLHGGDMSSVPPNKPLHQMLIDLASSDLFRNGNGIVRWTDERGLGAKDFFDDPARIPQVDENTFNEKIVTIVSQPSAQKFGTQFCTVGKQHPDKDVQELYDLERELALEKLREIAAKATQPNIINS